MVKAQPLHAQTAMLPTGINGFICHLSVCSPRGEGRYKRAKECGVVGRREVNSFSTPLKNFTSFISGHFLPYCPAIILLFSQPPQTN